MVLVAFLKAEESHAVLTTIISIQWSRKDDAWLFLLLGVETVFVS